MKSLHKVTTQHVAWMVTRAICWSSVIRQCLLLPFETLPNTIKKLQLLQATVVLLLLLYMYIMLLVKTTQSHQSYMCLHVYGHLNFTTIKYFKCINILNQII